MSETILDRLRILRQTVPAGTPTDRICRDAAVALEAERALADDLADVLNRWLDHRAEPEVEALLARWREARGRKGAK